MIAPFRSLLLCAVLFLSGVFAKAQGVFEEVEKKASALAAAPFQPLDRAVPEDAAKMSYNTYQAIRFNHDKALLAGTPLPFRLEMFYRGFIFPDHIRIHYVDGKTSSEVPFSPEMFTLLPGAEGRLPGLSPDYGFAGLKLIYNFTDERSWEEAMVFQGASYFRIPAGKQFFGLSARGIAINTAQKGLGEEFPVFTDFWVIKPVSGSKQVTVIALLNGPSVTGAYQFLIEPSATNTSVDVQASLFFRAMPGRVGYAPLTSMFWYGSNNYRKFPDYRPQVHDSDGLLMVNADGSRLWRPLQTVVEDLVDTYPFAKSPRGFGLLQRDRRFSSYEDIEAHYHLRPSLWVEPIGNWDGGSVVLWQIPTVDEYHDNIVAYWMPDQTPKAGEKRSLHYRLVNTEEKLPSTDGQVAGTYITSSYGKKDRFYIMVDFSWGCPKPPYFGPGEMPETFVKTDNGQVLNQYVKPNPDGQSWRLHMVVQFPSEKMKTSLSAGLTGKGGWKSEVWTYTFVPQE